ncbi:MAG: polysaccharide biosynthesis/export family protein [Acidobacteria bacterium]|nr:polysaccharide biosynthesis/export family protein [Acidobacteriota bacterium]
MVNAQEDYRIGTEDLIDVNVFQVPEMSGTARVSAGGEISLPLLGVVKAAGLTPRGLELLLQDKLRLSYLNDPHVGVFVREMHSHPVSVFGAVNRAGVFQVSGTKTLLEVLALAEGLSQDAGDTVLVMRGAGSLGNPGPSNAPEGATTPEWQEAGDAWLQGSPQDGHTVKVDLKDLLESGDPRYNVPVYPLDTVTVTRAGIVYVIGDVHRPGGFVLKTNENISVLQALALAEGLQGTSKKSAARIIRTDKTSGQRTEIAVDLGKILGGKATDPLLQPNDVLFVPNSTARSILRGGTQTVLSTLSGILIWRR